MAIPPNRTYTLWLVAMNVFSSFLPVAHRSRNNWNGGGGDGFLTN